MPGKGKTLVILESGSKVKKVQAFLGNNYIVKACFGHCRDLPVKTLGVDPANNYEPVYEIYKDKKKIVADLRKAYKEAGDLIVATDLDREGEAIGFHLCEMLKVSPKRQKRMVFNEITKTAILNAIKNLRPIDMNLFKAQEARRIIDRLIGYKISPMLWKHIANAYQKNMSLSAGRVQSVTLRLIVEKEEELKKHKPESSFPVTGYFIGNIIKAKLDENLDTLEDSREFLEGIKDADFKINSITKKKSFNNPPMPFITSTLQQEASNKFSMSPKRTMTVAQSLYEQGYITYMRTDSFTLSEDALSQLESHIKETYGNEYYIRREYKDNKETSQEAHEAIRPTTVSEVPELNDPAEEKLYKLIRDRTLASQMTREDLMNFELLIENSVYENMFKSKFQETVFQGFTIIYDKKKVVPPEVTALAEGDTIKYSQIVAEQEYSKPKNLRYTEANLIKHLDKLEIGRPSTYSNMVSVVQERNYVEKRDLEGKRVNMTTLSLNENGTITAETKEKAMMIEKNKLVPTPLGYTVDTFMVDNFAGIIDYGFTKNLEKELDEIATGKCNQTDTIDNLYNTLLPSLNTLDEKIKKESKRTLGNHPVTDAPVICYIGKYGPIVKHQETIVPIKKSNKRLEEITLADAIELLPQSITGDITIKNGKFGAYFSYNGKNYSLKNVEKPYTEDKCMEIVRGAVEPKMRKLSEQIIVRDGKYGPYFSFNGKNYKVKSYADSTLEECMSLIKNKK